MVFDQHFERVEALLIHLELPGLQLQRKEDRDRIRDLGTYLPAHHSIDSRLDLLAHIPRRADRHPGSVRRQSLGCSCLAARSACSLAFLSFVGVVKETKFRTIYGLCFTLFATFARGATFFVHSIIPLFNQL